MPTALQLWQELKQFLQLEISVRADDTSPDASATVIVTVRNSAHETDELPRIVFFDIHLDTEGGGRDTGHKTVGIDKELTPGQTLEFEFTCRYRHVAGFKANATAMVSRREFFKVNAAAIPPLEHTQASIRDYLDQKPVGEAQAHLTGILSELDMPDASTNFAEIPAKLESVVSTEEAIKDFLKDLQGVKSPFTSTRANPIVMSVAEITKPVLTNLSRMRKAATDNDPPALIEAGEAIVEAQTHLGAIAKAIADLRATHQLD